VFAFAVHSGGDVLVHFGRGKPVKRNRIALFGASALAVALFAVSVSADERHEFDAELDGFQEVPGTFTPGAGSLDLRVNADQTSIAVRVNYANLSTPPRAILVNFARSRTVGGIMAILCINGTPGLPACPAGTSGTLTATITAADVIAIPGQAFPAGDLAAFIDVVRHGAAYVNISTTGIPMGEIRGQIRAGDRDHD
jgi:hypothetical protein